MLEMLRPFELQPIPQARDFQEIAAKLVDMTEIGLPVFSFDCTPHDYETTQEKLDDILRELAFAQCQPATIVTPPAASSKALFIQPTNPLYPSKRRVDTLSFYYNVYGNTANYFLTPTRVFANSGRSLPETTDAVFMADAVDDAILEPVCFHNEQRPGELVVFRSLGQLPLACCHQAKTFPHMVRIWDADYTGEATTAGMPSAAG